MSRSWDGLLSPSGQDLSFDEDRHVPLEVRDAPAPGPRRLVHTTTVGSTHERGIGWRLIAWCSCDWQSRLYRYEERERAEAAAAEHARSAA